MQTSLFFRQKDPRRCFSLEVCAESDSEVSDPFSVRVFNLVAARSQANVSYALSLHVCGVFPRSEAWLRNTFPEVWTRV